MGRDWPSDETPENRLRIKDIATGINRR